MQGADYVIETGRPVLYLGGFKGDDQVVTADDLSRMVSQGELRYIYWTAQGGSFGSQSDVSSWVVSTCAAVQGFDTATRNAGAPDGTAVGSTGADGRQSSGGMQLVSLYDCGG